MPLMATAGDPAANSFCTLAEAWTILVGVLQPDAWTEATPSDQEAALMTATRLLTQLVDWYGTPTTATQALPWPQQGAVDRVGRALLSTVVPDDIKRATALYALALLKTSVQDPTLLQPFSEIWVGDMRVTMRGGSSMAPQYRVPQEVRSLLAIYGDIAGGATVRLSRT